jgi:hypothetical protein
MILSSLQRGSKIIPVQEQSASSDPRSRKWSAWTSESLILHTT